MHEIKLAGCTPEPLMNYLKALGVFRLATEQADPNAKLSWHGGIAHLQCSLDRDAFIEFFLVAYKPTPILAPWNGGSGFYGGGSDPLVSIANSDVERLSQYRNTIARVREFVPKSKPKDEDKEALLVQCRARLADEVVPWLDVCFVLGEERPSFFPLLGTGGNDGRLDFTNNFMQRLADVMPFGDESKPTNESKDLLAAALFDDTLASLSKTAIGQFNPGGIGGANGRQGSFEAGSRVNPWDFVLMIEGALLLAGSLARRMGSNTSSRAVFPFSVDSIAVGYGSATASEETTDSSRAELWLPLWSNRCSLEEIRHLFGEGRAQLGRRQARNAVEFALAVNLLGVNRGVTSFARYAFLKRNGLAFLAAPLSRVEVRLRPKARLLSDPPLAEWVDRLRRACRDKDSTPARYQSALRNIDRAFFNFASRSEQGNDKNYLLDVLVALGQAERSLANGLHFAQANYIRPIQGLNNQWLEQANDGSLEFRLATSLAGIQSEKDVGPLRVFLEAIETKGRYVSWSSGSTSVVWSNRPVAANLAAVFCRRQMEAFRAGLVGVPIRSRRTAPLADVLSFLNGNFDEAKLASLLWALPAVDWSSVGYLYSASNQVDTNIPFEFGLLRLLVEPLSLIEKSGCWRMGTTSEATTPDPDVFLALASGQKNAIGFAADRAARRLKSGGRLVNGYRNRQQAGKSLAIESSLSADRLLAAMLFPLSDYDLELIANAVLYPPENEE